MIVEDDLVIAMAAETMLSRLGVAETHTALSTETALNLIEHQPLDLVLLDLDIGYNDSVAIAKRLSTTCIRLIVTTVALYVPYIPGDVWLLRKPYFEADLRRAIFQG